MLKPVLTQLPSEVHDIKVGVGHTQAGLELLRQEHEQMRAALAAQGFHLPPAGPAAAAAAPLPALPDADMAAARGAGSLPAGGASAASAAQPGGWRQVLSNAAPVGAAASVARATAGVPLGLGAPTASRQRQAQRASYHGRKRGAPFRVLSTAMALMTMSSTLSGRRGSRAPAHSAWPSRPVWQRRSMRSGAAIPVGRLRLLSQPLL